jgi:hypothetical protein
MLCGRCLGNASGTARAQDFPLHHAFLVTCKNAINPCVTNGAITVAAEMRFPRWFEPYICLALALFLIWDFGSGLVEWLTTGQLLVWCFFGNLDHYVIFRRNRFSSCLGLSRCRS